MTPDKPPRERRDPTRRTPEFIALDVLEGPCTRFFHRFVTRRMMSVTNPRPYPPVIGGLHRLARMLDIAERWELAVLALLPVALAAALNWRHLHVPAALGGFIEVGLAVYVGYWFVLLVFIDRRLDHDDLLRVKHMRFVKAQAREARMLRRRDLARTREEVRARAAEAEARGRARSRQPYPLAAPALEELLPEEAPRA